MARLAITSGAVELVVETRDTETSRRILATLPLRARAMTWGEEVYFMVPVDAGREKTARSVVEPGEIAFWTEGHAIAIGYGRTPLSKDAETRLAAPCNIWADALGDVRVLDEIADGDEVVVKKLP